MTYNVGDDATRTYTVIDDNGGSIALDPTVLARNSASDELTVTADWATAVAPLPDPPVAGTTFRDLDLPLYELPAGLLGLTLGVPDDTDLFLGNVVIE